MNDQGAIDVLTTLLSKKWPDEEIPTDITFLRQQLQKDIKELRCACARTRTRARSLFWCRVAGGARGGRGEGGIGLHLVSAWPARRGPLRVRRFVQLRTCSSGRLRRLHRRGLFVVTVLNELCAFLRLLHSTWSVYRTDVLSGEISWRNPCHNDETFWRQNMLRFEENDCKVLR